MRPVTCLLIGIVVVLGCEPPPRANQVPASGGQGAAGPTSTSTSTGDPKEAFLAAFRSACESKNVDTMLGLYCLDGIGAEMRETVRENIQDELDQPLADLQWEVPEPGKYGPRDEGGIRWKPNLPVVAVLKAKYAPGPPGTGLHLSAASHAVGLKGGRYLITVPIRD